LVLGSIASSAGLALCPPPPPSILTFGERKI
jgi:hypothetical protein